MRYVIARIDDNLFASEVATGIDILKTITWVADAWKEFSVETIKTCFAKFGITEQSNENDNDIVNEEFNVLFSELARNCLIAMKEKLRRKEC